MGLVKVKGYTKKNWKSDVLVFLNNAGEEVKQFKKTGKEIYLMQAAEKTWRAFVSLVKAKAGKEVVSPRGRRYYAKKLGLFGVYHYKLCSHPVAQDAVLLHSYFYGGEVADSSVVVGLVRDVGSKIRRAL